MTWSLVGALHELAKSPPMSVATETPDVAALPIEVQDAYVAALAYKLDTVAFFVQRGDFDSALRHIQQHDDAENPLTVLAKNAWKQIKALQKGSRGRLLTYGVVREFFTAVSEEMWRRGEGKALDCAVWGGQIESGRSTFTARCSGVEWTEDHCIGQRGRLPCLGRMRTFRPYAVLRFLPEGKRRHRTYAVRCIDWVEMRQPNPKGSWHKIPCVYHQTEVPK